MARAASLYRRFLASTRAVAAIEFAAITPVFLLLFLGSIDAARAISIYMKVRAATYVLGAITNQYSTIHDTDMQSILGATTVVLSPYPSGPVSVVLSQVSISAAGQTTATVCNSTCWSDTLNGTALATGATVTLPAGLASATAPTTCQSYPCYLLYGQVQYTYTPMFGYFVTGTIALSDSLFVTPRNVTAITRTSP
ncbi:MAG TPA: TadE/TadG family type IV pilus assembly protein [Xanthobacteraceae bacterium]|nr:TadE/TadG family type IV pilus assembly protein [Xanthobacteraceae bacterium]